MHLHPPIPLDDWRMTCPCGARTDHAYDLCRKCRARFNWQRRKRRIPRATRIRRTFRGLVEAVSE